MLCSALDLAPIKQALAGWLATTWPEVGRSPWNQQYTLDGVEVTFRRETVNKPFVVL